MPINDRASQLAAEYRRKLRPGRTGALASTFRHDLVSAVVDGGRVAQVVTVTVDDDNEKTYTLGVLGIDVTFEAESSDNEAAIAIGLAAAVNAEPLLGQRVEADTYADTVILTAKFPGLDLEVDASDADLSAVVTTAASGGAAVPFGTVCVLEPVDRDSGGGGSHATYTARLPETTDVSTGAIVAGTVLAVAIARHDEEVDSQGQGGYGPADTGEFGRACDFYLEGAPETAPASILVGTAGAERGRIFFAAGANRVPLPGARWGGHRGEGVAIIELR